MQSTAKLSSKIAFCVAVWLIGSPIATAQPMLQHLEIPRGYQPLDYPRDFGGASLAGQLVQLSRGKGFRHLGHLRDCGLPESALKPTSGLVGLAALSRKSARLEASITATFLSLFGLEFKGDAARQVEITLDGAIEEYLSPLAVVGAARAYDELLQERCGNLLRLANVYWINSAIKVEKLSLRLLNSAGGQLAGSAQELGAYVSGLAARPTLGFPLMASSTFEDRFMWHSGTLRQPSS